MSFYGTWTLAYTASSAVLDPLLGAAVAEQDYFDFLVTWAPVQNLPILNCFGSINQASGGYIRVPARLRRI